MDLPVLVLLFAAAAGDAAEPAKVVETTIGVAEHARRFVEPGLGSALPQVLLYSPQGVCVAVFGESVRGRLLAAIADAATHTEEVCAVPRPPESAAGDAPTRVSRISVELITLDAPFCGACDALRKEFDQLRAAQPGYRYWITKVNLGKAFNPTKPNALAPRSDAPPPR